MDHRLPQISMEIERSICFADEKKSLIFFNMFGIEKYDAVVISGLLVFMGVLEALYGAYTNDRRRGTDWWVDILSFVHATTFSKPLIVLVTTWLMNFFVPDLNAIWTNTNFWLALVFILLVEDFIQYWYHRKAHEWKWLWNFHRPHHSSPEMGVLLTFRENIFYVLLIPNIWFLAVMTYLGLGAPIMLAITLKYIVIIGAHSEVRWDKFLYSKEWLSPVAWVVQRTISTPATHWAHHGKSSKDGISNPSGNFSNMFFFWDIIFGTALITQQYPTEFGLENDPKDHWAPQLYWPIIKSKQPGSEIGDGYDRPSTAFNKPTRMKVEAGKNYWWCSCGMSRSQPFCDGSHNGSSFKPVKMVFDKEQQISFCNCKRSAKGPICDGTHKDLAAPKGEPDREGTR